MQGVAGGGGDIRRTATRRGAATQHEGGGRRLRCSSPVCKATWGGRRWAFAGVSCVPVDLTTTAELQCSTSSRDPVELTAGGAAGKLSPAASSAALQRSPAAVDAAVQRSVFQWNLSAASEAKLQRSVLQWSSRRREALDSGSRSCDAAAGGGSGLARQCLSAATVARRSNGALTGGSRCCVAALDEPWSCDARLDVSATVKLSAVALGAVMQRPVVAQDLTPLPRLFTDEDRRVHRRRQRRLVIVEKDVEALVLWRGGFPQDIVDERQFYKQSRSEKDARRSERAAYREDKRSRKQAAQLKLELQETSGWDFED
ncbi:hypothetical protein TRIUR3_13638 [Triticum urartu]|uniref:Uncharacterized protein n=1 Tax=Triticum urartu TaxID=4572 RepID=M7ZT34_TRIUA|nr:hypothetical protein TRIUR3_13638 [Triticum urartu]